jgi:hypothetical protein
MSTGIDAWITPRHLNSPRCEKKLGQIMYSPHKIHCYNYVKCYALAHCLVSSQPISKEGEIGLICRVHFFERRAFGVDMEGIRRYGMFGSLRIILEKYGGGGRLPCGLRV